LQKVQPLNLQESVVTAATVATARRTVPIAVMPTASPEANAKAKAPARVVTQVSARLKVPVKVVTPVSVRARVGRVATARTPVGMAASASAKLAAGKTGQQAIVGLGARPSRSIEAMAREAFRAGAAMRLTDSSAAQSKAAAEIALVRVATVAKAKAATVAALAAREATAAAAATRAMATAKAAAVAAQRLPGADPNKD
jgi:hypothetical protein